MTARTGRVSDFTASKWLDSLAADTTHLALMLADPYTVIDPLTVEVAGTYTRVSVAWTKSVRLLRNTAALSWAGIPAGTTVVAIAGFTAAFNGVMTFSCPYGPVPYAGVGGLQVPANAFFVGLDA